MKQLLCRGFEKLQINYSENQIDLCLAYLLLLKKWNKAFNLTAVTQPNKMVSHLLLDSLSLLPHLTDKVELLDVGSGAGLPGIPLSIFLPEAKWVLCDSNGKKTRFMQQASAELGLKNISVVNKRIEDYHRARSFDVILSKAFASLPDFISSVQHLCSDKTELMTLKSGLGSQEKQDIDFNNKQLIEEFIEVPGINESRSIVIIKNK